MKKNFWIFLAVFLLLAAVCVAVYVFTGCGSVAKVTRTAETSSVPAELPSANGTSWLELPGEWRFEAEHCITHYAQMEGRLQRN